MIKIEQVEQSLQIVQAILGLQDWRITPYVTDRSHLKEVLKDRVPKKKDDEIFGCILIRSDFRTADLYIWDNLDTSKLSQGLEHTIFHECIHIVLCRYDKMFKFIIKDKNRLVVKVLRWAFTTLEEQIVNQLSDGYINCLRIIQAKNESKDENQPPK